MGEDLEARISRQLDKLDEVGLSKEKERRIHKRIEFLEALKAKQS